jgi:hypothetical protein
MAPCSVGLRAGCWLFERFIRDIEVSTDWSLLTQSLLALRSSENLGLLHCVHPRGSRQGNFEMELESARAYSREG